MICDGDLPKPTKFWLIAKDEGGPAGRASLVPFGSRGQLQIVDAKLLGGRLTRAGGAIREWLARPASGEGSGMGHEVYLRV